MPIDATAVANATGTSFTYSDNRVNKSTFLKQRIAVLGQGTTAANASYGTEPYLVSSAAEVATKYGAGSPLHLMVDKLLPSNGKGVGTVEVTVYPLKNHGSGVAAAGTVTPSGTATAAGSFKLRIAGIMTPSISFAAGAVNATTMTTALAAAVNSVPMMPVTTSGTTSLTLTSKWQGVSANDILIEVVDTNGKPLTLPGLVLTVVQPTGGTNNPDVSAQLSAIGPRWETILLNQFGPADATTLDLIKTWGDGRWDALEHKPAFSVCGSREPVLATLTAITNGRSTDKVNVVIPAPGSPNLGFVIAASAVAAIASEANNNPPSGYNRLTLEGIIAGTNAVQWNYSQRNTAVSAGLSTTEVIDNVVVCGNTITCYHPTGESPPAYSEVVNIVKLQNVAFTYDTEFNSRRWQGCILIGDDDVSNNPRSRRPKDIKAVCKGLNNGLGSMAIIRDVAITNPNILVLPDSNNPNRVNIKNPIRVSSNINITDVENLFSFAFGG